LVLATTDLGESYRRCRDIHRDRGRSYYLATWLLPAHKRNHVHALYAFTRRADDIVDSPAAVAGRSQDGVEPQEELEEWATALHAGLAGAPITDPVLPAVIDTIRTYGIDLADVDAFLRSMAMDLTVTEYATYADLLGYMDGSSAVIGTMMVPILGVVPGADAATAHAAARELGYAFQLTNFIRDVREDLDRGRVYLPGEDLAEFQVTRAMLHADADRGEASTTVRELIEYECQRALGHYAAALPGVTLLEPRSQLCIRAAYLLYGGILDEVARGGYDVMRGRAVVPGPRRAQLIAAAMTPATFDRHLRRRFGRGRSGYVRQ
jgi:15-cis-phytoene synthase